MEAERQAVRPSDGEQATPDLAGWVAEVQALLDLLPGSVALLTPVRDPRGRLVDYCIRAASPEAVDMAGRHGRELVGMRILDAYPTVADTELWQAYEQVLTTGASQEVGPFTYTQLVADLPAEARYTVRVNRLGAGLLIAWVGHDEQQRHALRMAHMERLGNLGWAEWDLLDGQSTHSDHLYAILGRDPADGPLPIDACADLVLPEDQAAVRESLALLIERGKPLDVQCRIRTPAGIRHVRLIADATQDATGRPLRLHGTVQDVTARQRLVDMQRELAVHQRTLETGQQLAVQLQRIILPQPPDPVDLPGLRLAVRYLPAEEVVNVGGDWYHAGVLPDGGGILLAIGDVAGHGLEAAATMAQLRHAMVALTVTSTDPAELLTYLNRVLYDHAEAIATAIVARYDPAAHKLTWAQAGHPAPLLARAGCPAPLPRPEGLALGAIRDAAYEQAIVPFAPGDVLLAFTDGLVERRGRSPDDGLAEVIEVVSDALAAAPRGPLAEILARLRQANPDDDTCILAARPTR